MTARFIDGKAIAKRILSETEASAAELRSMGRPPCLLALRIGDDPAAASYARSQAKRAASVGVDYRLIEMPPETHMEEAADRIRAGNADPAVSGIMLHLPVPKALDAYALQQVVGVEKDVEGVGAANLGRLALGREALVPCTAAAAFACLESTQVEIEGAEAVVIGRSAIVGRPLGMLLLAAHATVTQCHTRTKDLMAHTRRARILVVAAGVPGLIGSEHVSEGAIVIDVGTHRVPDGCSAGTPKMKTVGDVRTSEVASIAEAITPVPGGVGPVTVAMLLSNTVHACRRSLR